MTTSGCQEGWVKVFSSLAFVVEMEERDCEGMHQPIRVAVSIQNSQVGAHGLFREFTDSWRLVELEGALQWANGKSCSWRRWGSHEGQISKFGFYLGDIGGCLSYLALCNKAP